MKGRAVGHNFAMGQPTVSPSQNVSAKAIPYVKLILAEEYGFIDSVGVFHSHVYQ